MVHYNRVRGAGVRHARTQHPHVHLQVVEEAAVEPLRPGVRHGDVPRHRPGADVPRGAARSRRRQGGDVDQLRVLRSRITR